MEMTCDASITGKRSKPNNDGKGPYNHHELWVAEESVTLDSMYKRTWEGDSSTVKAKDSQVEISSLMKFDIGALSMSALRGGRKYFCDDNYAPMVVVAALGPDPVEASELLPETHKLLIGCHYRAFVQSLSRGEVAVTKQEELESSAKEGARLFIYRKKDV